MENSERYAKTIDEARKALLGQLDLLCERSQKAEDCDLPQLTDAMIEVLNMLLSMG